MVGKNDRLTRFKLPIYSLRKRLKYVKKKRNDSFIDLFLSSQDCLIKVYSAYAKVIFFFANYW